MIVLTLVNGAKFSLMAARIVGVLTNPAGRTQVELDTKGPVLLVQESREQVHDLVNNWLRPAPSALLADLAAHGI